MSQTALQERTDAPSHPDPNGSGYAHQASNGPARALSRRPTAREAVQAGRELLGRALALGATGVRICTALIALGIVFKALDANTHNSIVSATVDAANGLATPFNDMFKLDSARFTDAVNWGIALVVYLIGASVISGVAEKLRPTH